MKHGISGINRSVAFWRARERLNAALSSREMVVVPGVGLVPLMFINALIGSILLHTVVVFGMRFTMPRMQETASHTPIEVVLVNSKSPRKPVKADRLAQANLDGGGNTDEKRRAKTPLPHLPNEIEDAPEVDMVKQRKELEAEAERLMTQLKAKQSVPTATDKKAEESASEDPRLDPNFLEKSRATARLEAEIARNYDQYQERPKRKFFGGRAQEYRFAVYLDQWREKIERIGNLNYPAEAKAQRLHGRLRLTVAIKHDGTVEAVVIEQSSGKKILDEAAKRIVYLASPFAKFPTEIRKDTDILHVTRTWSFTANDELGTE